MLNNNQKDIIEVTDYVVLDEEENQEEIEMKENEEKKQKKNGLDGFEKFLVIFTAAFVIISIFFAQICIVSGDSMLPNLHDGDTIIIEKITKNYERMDIVVLKWNRRKLVKRIVGLPGEEIKIENDKIFINGQEIEDVVEGSMGYAGIAKKSIVLGDDEYFVLGDNRENSLDSRDNSIGVIKKDKIMGKKIFVFSFK